jgi:hypothetical protein
MVADGGPDISHSEEEEAKEIHLNLECFIEDTDQEQSQALRPSAGLSHDAHRGLRGILTQYGATDGSINETIGTFQAFVTAAPSNW